ncbi:OHCU decarboxylase, partial [Streptomyces hayashii]
MSRGGVSWPQPAQARRPFLTATEAPVTSTSPLPGLARFNALEESAARAALHEACASTAWGDR